ncbi:MAG: PIN domain-containing protein [Nitrospinae bacterium]|nr:PIN domain-containing protein [Nitrospinota bacterium]
MEDRVFVDTNILIYAHDTSAGIKHKKAQDIIVDLWESGLGILSIQVLQEFFVCVTNKISKPLTLDKTKEIIESLLKWNIVVNDGEFILKAIEIHRRYRYSFWDSMIIQAAIKGNANFLLSEDLSNDQIIEGVRVKNPFL